MARSTWKSLASPRPSAVPLSGTDNVLRTHAGAFCQHTSHQGGAAAKAVLRQHPRMRLGVKLGVLHHQSKLLKRVAVFRSAATAHRERPGHLAHVKIIL